MKKIVRNNVDCGSSEDEEFYCLVCCEAFTTAGKKEMWVQCVTCKLCSHSSCTEQLQLYICQNSDSNSD